MNNYIIPIVIVLLVFVVVIFVYRKKHHNEISKLEQKRLEIQNKPVLDELSKVKKLNMSGQAEEMFERWRNKWTELIDDDLSKIEAELEQVEILVDKFQFKKAMTLEQEIEQQIDRCDEEMDSILTELNELMDSEKQSRDDIEKLKLDYRTARKTLLAHQYSFGDAGTPLEQRLEGFPSKFDEYELLIKDGNYLQAKEIVQELDKEGQEIFQLIQEIPTLLTEIQHKIPSDIAEIRGGHRHMETESFFLLHLEIPEKLDAIEALLPKLKEEIVELSTEHAKEQVEKVRNDIESYYDALENEVLAKQYVDQHFKPIGEYLEKVYNFVDSMKKESDLVSQSYHLSADDLAIPVKSKTALNSFKQRYEFLAVEVKEEQSAYSSLKEELEDLNKLITKEEEQAEVYSRKLVDLRVHENEGREKLVALEKRLRVLERRMQKSNLPGIPDEITARFKESENQLEEVKAELLQEPINVGIIAAELEKSISLIEEAESVIDELLENVQLLELLIQYGNRYRTVKPLLDERLTEAEEAFRNLRFNKALEIVAAAVNEVEPGALKKIQELAQDPVIKS